MTPRPGVTSGRRNWTTLNTRTPARATPSTARVARCGAAAEDLLREARSERENEPVATSEATDFVSRRPRSPVAPSTIL